MVQSHYPLFPLPTILVPHGKMSLQIFEQRYLNLIKQCLRESTTFGLIQLQKGSELMRDGRRSPPIVASRGTVAAIVDWDQLSNGLLGVTIQGQQTFLANALSVAADGLVVCEAEFEPVLESVPMQSVWDGLAEVLASLETHPHVESLQLQVDYQDAWQVGYHLLQLLPLEESLKLELLSPTSIEHLMSTLDQVLTELSGD
jgi:uncharacterized protein